MAKDKVYEAMQGMGLINGLLETSINQPAPTVGMGVTMFFGSDRRPGTVLEVLKDGRDIKVGTDTFKNTAEWPAQEWDITPAKPENGFSLYRICADGKYRFVGATNRTSMKERSIMVGSRECYMNPEF